MRYHWVRFNELTIVRKHHSPSIQHRFVRIDAILFCSIQLTHCRQKASWSMYSKSLCSNRYKLIRFDVNQQERSVLVRNKGNLTSTCLTQSITVGRIDSLLPKLMLDHVPFASFRFRSQLAQSIMVGRIGVILFDSI